MIKLTEEAAAHIKAWIEKDEREYSRGIRIATVPAGCNGFKYHVEVVDGYNPDDTMYFSKEVMIVVDPVSLMYLEDIEIDYIVDGLGKRLDFNNPQTVGVCGCGESFYIGEADG